MKKLYFGRHGYRFLYLKLFQKMRRILFRKLKSIIRKYKLINKYRATPRLFVIQKPQLFNIIDKNLASLTKSLIQISIHTVSSLVAPSAYINNTYFLRLKRRL